MKNILYDVQWQRLRVSFLAVHHNAGGFTTEGGTNDNLQRLHGYIYQTDPPITAAERAARVWRGLNLLNATRMGYSGQGLEGTPQDEAVRKYRDSLQQAYDPHLFLQIEDSWDWNKVREDLRVLYTSDYYWFKAIRDDLKRRVRQSNKRANRGGYSIEETRTQLLTFMQLMDEVDPSGRTQPGETVGS